MENKKIWEIVAQDFNSPFIRNYYWVKGMLEQSIIFDIPQVKIGIIGKKGAIEYIADLKTWEAAHNSFRKRVESDYNVLKKLMDDTLVLGEEAKKWCKDKIAKVDLSVLSNKQLYEIYKEGLEKTAVLYAYGVMLPILDFQKFSFVEKNLDKILKKYAPRDYKTYYKFFTAPAHDSFAREQEIALLKMMEKWGDKLSKNIASLGIEDIKMNHPSCYEDIKKHTENFAWVYYAYAGPGFTDGNFLKFIKSYVEKGVFPNERLNSWKKEKENTNKGKNEFIKSYNLTNFERFILDITGEMVWSKPIRKDYQSIIYYNLEKVQKELAKRIFVTLDQIRSTPIEDLSNAIFENTDIDIERVNSLNKLHVIMPFKGGIMEVLSGQDALNLSNNHVKREGKIFEDVKELVGKCACEGQAKGTAKIINKTEDMDKMNDGDILVSVATTPNIISAMKKASAIVTDEGGLTCHAAIVARELQIPCVIGTKIATKVLKDNDKIFVDADNGLVKKVEINKDKKLVKIFTRDFSQWTNQLLREQIVDNIPNIWGRGLRDQVVLYTGRTVEWYRYEDDYAALSEYMTDKSLDDPLFNEKSNKVFQNNVSTLRTLISIDPSTIKNPLEHLHKIKKISKQIYPMYTLSVFIPGYWRELFFKKHGEDAQKVIDRLYKSREKSEGIFKLTDLFLRQWLGPFLQKLGIPSKHFVVLSIEEIENLIAGSGSLDKDQLEKLHKGYVFINGEIIPTENQVEYLSSIGITIDEKIPKNNEDNLSGTVACLGPKIIGKVTTLFNANEVESFPIDGIMVTHMTSPEYIPAMKRAKAIITDEGGLTCHAAIVSRELDIPCIIGTKIATKVFKDGDLVEVDANKGIIKKL